LLLCQPNCLPVQPDLNRTLSLSVFVDNYFTHGQSLRHVIATIPEKYHQVLAPAPANAGPGNRSIEAMGTDQLCRAPGRVGLHAAVHSENKFRQYYKSTQDTASPSWFMKNVRFSNASPFEKGGQRGISCDVEIISHYRLFLASLASHFSQVYLPPNCE